MFDKEVGSWPPVALLLALAAFRHYCRYEECGAFPSHSALFWALEGVVWALFCSFELSLLNSLFSPPPSIGQLGFISRPRLAFLSALARRRGFCSRNLTEVRAPEHQSTGQWAVPVEWVFYNKAFVACPSSTGSSESYLLLAGAKSKG